MCHYSITGLVGTHSNQKKVTQKFHVSTPLTGTSASITEAHNLYQQRSSQGGNASNGIFFFVVPSFQGQDESNHKLMGSTHFSTPNLFCPSIWMITFTFSSITSVYSEWSWNGRAEGRVVHAPPPKQSRPLVCLANQGIKKTQYLQPSASCTEC